MNLEVTQNNLYLFLPSKISWLATMQAQDRNINVVDAIKEIYASTTYHTLEREDTKLWHLGPVDLYRDINSAQQWLTHSSQSRCSVRTSHTSGA